MRKVQRLGVLVIASLLIVLAGCTGKSEEDIRMATIKKARTMTNELVEARTDNRSIEDVNRVFNKYRDNILASPWLAWFDTSNPYVEDKLMVAESYGYIPVHREHDVFNYGEEVGEEGFSFTVVTTIDVEDNEREVKEQVRVYSVYKYNENGYLEAYESVHRMLGAGTYED